MAKMVTARVAFANVVFRATLLIFTIRGMLVRILVQLVKILGHILSYLYALGASLDPNWLAKHGTESSMQANLWSDIVFEYPYSMKKKLLPIETSTKVQLDISPISQHHADEEALFPQNFQWSDAFQISDGSAGNQFQSPPPPPPPPPPPLFSPLLPPLLSQPPQSSLRELNALSPAKEEDEKNSDEREVKQHNIFKKWRHHRRVQPTEEKVEDKIVPGDQTITHFYTAGNTGNLIEDIEEKKPELQAETEPQADPHADPHADPEENEGRSPKFARLKSVFRKHPPSR